MPNLLSPIDQKNIVTLEVDGVSYGGWKGIRIKHSIENLAGTYQLDVSDRWPGQTQAWEIEAGASCVIKIGADVVITGYVDTVSVSASHTEHTISVSGRDKTGDLVDCSAQPNEWGGQSFEAIAQALCKPFGVEVFSQLGSGSAGYVTPPKSNNKANKKKAGKGGGTIPKKANNTGDTVHKTLEKFAKMKGVLLVSDRTGGLIITRAGLGGRANDMLVLGDNLKTIDYERDFSELFSEIVVKGQATGATPKASAGLFALPAPQSVKPSAKVERKQSTGSASLKRHRPLILIADNQADSKRCKERAEWEAGTREAKSKKITAKVQGWRQSNGALWEINTLVRMRCPWVREEDDMLVSSVEYSIDLSGGTVTTLSLCGKQAFDVLPEIPDASGGKGKTSKTREKNSGAGRDYGLSGRNTPRGAS